jgi:hypothetical protein
VTVTTNPLTTQTDPTALTGLTVARRRRARWRFVPVVAGALLFAGVTAACSSDSESDSETAAQKVCTARDDLRTSVGEVNDALTSANLGSASEAMDVVRDDVEALMEATGELSDTERERLQPQIDAARAQVEALADVRDVAGLQAGVEAIGASLEEIFTEISETLDCP